MHGGGEEEQGEKEEGPVSGESEEEGVEVSVEGEVLQETIPQGHYHPRKVYEDGIEPARQGEKEEDLNGKEDEGEEPKLGDACKKVAARHDEMT